MNTIFQGFLALYLAAVVYGSKCCAPKEMEGLMYGEGNLEKPESGFASQTMRDQHVNGLAKEKNITFAPLGKEEEEMYYDANAKKFALVGEFEKDGDFIKYKEISDYNTKKRYLIRPDTNECKVEDISEDFAEMCIPDSATSKGDSHIGVGVKKLNIESFVFKINDDTSFSGVTKHDCVPIFEKIMGKKNNVNYFESINYLDMKKTISKPEVFTVPAYCNKDPMDDSFPRF